MFVDIIEGEAYFEWIIDDYRFGFSFRHDPSDSFRFLVWRDPAEVTDHMKGDFISGYRSVVNLTPERIQACGVQPIPWLS